MAVHGDLQRWNYGEKLTRIPHDKISFADRAKGPFVRRNIFKFTVYKNTAPYVATKYEEFCSAEK